MNQKLFAVGAFALSAVFSVGVQAQGPPPGPRPAFRPGPFEGFGPFMGGPGKVVTGQPYSAQVTVEHTQTLSNGSQIDQKNTANVYRDSQGRTRSEETFNGPGGNVHQIVTITDPVAGMNYVLDPSRKTARETTLPTWKGGTVPPRPPRPNGNVNPNVKSLGGQTINGVYAEGTQMTHSIPPGQMGNTDTIQTVTTRWHSPDLDIDVQSQTNDPLHGNTSLNVSNISRSEPGPTLFQVPSDYTVTKGGPRNRGPRPGQN